jgi:hypothetical protein
MLPHVTLGVHAWLNQARQDAAMLDGARHRHWH